MFYSYDPTKCVDGNYNQMRFELGDTAVEQGEISCALSNEEYDAIIKSSENWKQAKLKCLEAIVMKLSYEVDTSVDGLSYGLSQRADRWRAMYKDLKQELRTCSPPVNTCGIVAGHDKPFYFHTDMHTNNRKM